MNLLSRLQEEARQKRDEGIQRADDHADIAWKDQALAAVKRTCEQLPEFLCDDVWTFGGLESTREDRALGPVMREAARRGYCTRTDRTRPSIRSHLSPKPIWRSNLFEAAVAA